LRVTSIHARCASDAFAAISASAPASSIVPPERSSVVMRATSELVAIALKCAGDRHERGRPIPALDLRSGYTEHLERLRARNVGAKRSLAIREYALGLEALHRCVEREPLYRVHECVFGVLALESEPVDPRL
jgi:protein phosphatase